MRAVLVHAVGGLSLALGAACGGASAGGPATQEIAVDRSAPARPDGGDPCPAGAHRDGELCVTSVVPTCASGTKLVPGRGCVADRPRTTGMRWQAPTPLQPPDVAIARARFARGIGLYDSADYNGALSELEGAYAASPVTPVLFNIGACLEKLGRGEEAIDVYERFIEATPPGPRVDDARGRIDRIRKMLGR